MEKSIDDVKKEVWGLFKSLQPVHLATIDGNTPRVRPVTLIHFGKKMWVTTGSGDAKIKQINENDKIEFCLLLGVGENSGYVRCLGRAEIVGDEATRRLIAENTPFFKTFWKDTNDPGYALLRIHAKEVEYLRPGEFNVERFSVT
jgi:uncharacterized pyridoxamine 5'-phosphate oxidase family protein